MGLKYKKKKKKIKKNLLKYGVGFGKEDFILSDSDTKLSIKRGNLQIFSQFYAAHRLKNIYV